MLRLPYKKELLNLLRQNKNLEIIENEVIELLVKDNVCHGVVFMKNSEYYVANSGAIIIATGGLGQIYKYTTNPEGATGDGIALAYEAGAEIQDIEFIQFHPTALALDNKSKNRFLISEAVRGEGAKLLNNKGVEFPDLSAATGGDISEKDEDVDEYIVNSDSIRYFYSEENPYWDTTNQISYEKWKEIVDNHGNQYVKFKDFSEPRRTGRKATVYVREVEEDYRDSRMQYKWRDYIVFYSDNSGIYNVGNGEDQWFVWNEERIQYDNDPSRAVKYFVEGDVLKLGDEEYILEQ